MTLEDSANEFRLRVMTRAQVLGNVTKTCREFGISRSLFYRWRKRYLAYGRAGLHPGWQAAQRGRPPTLSLQAERAILALAVAWPTWGPLRLAQQLALPDHGGWKLAASTIYRLLRRSGLQTRWERLAVLEAHSAQVAGLLTECTRRQLLAAQRRVGKHIQAEKPGELVCLDAFYIGKLKGVGKVWQPVLADRPGITACDAASSFAVAEITLDFTTQATAQFLAKRVVPAFRKAGWPVERVLTDQGNEFRGAFDHACTELGIRHTRTQPRHAWTNGFVERLQGTILNEHWRIEPALAVGQGFAAGTSPELPPCRPRWIGTWTSLDRPPRRATTGIDLTKATEPKAEPPARFKPEGDPIMPIHHEQEVSTPIRYWTA